ncbi:DedA family protein [Streptacidiphilus sp. N1-12]|uniref:DedA family protein n=2 Tax=Streptacidiphilus alkalitolerans TaxID=3342712 RepID=A0ABV6WGB9_9ACTN
MQAITDWLQNLSGPLVYLVVAALVFSEDAFFFGFVLPGETAVVIGGVIASAHHGVDLPVLMLVVVLAAVIGDSVGYEIGRRFGPRLLATGFATKHKDRVERSRAFMRDRGPVAVFLGRFVALFRAMVPALAGLSQLPYRRFLLFNAAGGLVWGVGYTLLGYLAGSAYKRVASIAGEAAAGVVGGIVVVALIVWAVRRHRAENAVPSAGPSSSEHTAGEGAAEED